MITAENTLNVEDAMTFFKFNLYKRNKKATLIGLITASLAGIFMVGFGFFVGRISFMIEGIVVAILLPLLFYKWNERKLRKVIKKNRGIQSGDTQYYRFEDEGFIRTNDNEDFPERIEMEWEDLHEVCETKNYFYFYVRANTGFFIHHDNFNVSDIEEVRKFLKERVGDRYRAVL